MEDHAVLENQGLGGAPAGGGTGEELSQQPGPNTYCFPVAVWSPLHSWASAWKPRSSFLAYRVGRVQQGDIEGNEPWEAGVWESQALHIEVCAVLATLELQQVRGMLWPQDHAVPGGLFVCWERAGEAQVCVPTSETLSSWCVMPSQGRGISPLRTPHSWIWQEPPLRRKELKALPSPSQWRSRNGVMRVPESFTTLQKVQYTL